MLVVDDSVVVRRLVSEALSREPDLEVVATASSGAIALARAEQLGPDVVTLDVAMDGMSGLETLSRLRALRPATRVVMFSAHTARGAEATIEALLLGADDYVLKPSAAAGQDAAAVLGELARKIRTLAPARAPAHPAPPAAPRGGSPTRRVDALALGLSTGGPNALTELLPALPGDLPVPVLVVQHMPPVFTKHLAEALAPRCALRVEEAVDGAVVEPGTVWIAPGDHHMRVTRRDHEVRLALSSTEPPEHSCRPAVDVLFRSVAQVYGSATLAVIMTGMGQDGLVGCQHVKEAGGQVVAQDQATSVVWGMPGFVVRAGLADAVLPLAELAGELRRRVDGGRAGGVAR